jgi:hypothetical protein
VEGTSSTSEWIIAHRRAVTLSAISIIFMIGVVRVYLVGEWDSANRFVYDGFARNIIDSLLSTILVSCAIAAFFWWVRAPITRTPLGGELFPDVISKHLEAAANVADHWEYFGHTGRYVRSRILPILGARSKALSTTITVRFIIINPDNVTLCSAYADYRSRSRSSTITPRSWNVETVQADLIATIICLIQMKAKYPQLDIMLGLYPSFGLWRIDKSNEMAVVTQEDPQQPAYRYVRGSRFFGYCRQECEEAWRQAIQYKIQARPGSPLREDELRANLHTTLGPAGQRLEVLFPRAFQMAAESTSYA